MLPAGQPRDDGRQRLPVRLVREDVGDIPPSPACLEIFHHLVDGADERVGAGENLVSTQGRPRTRELLCSLLPIVRDDDALDQRIQLEPLEALPRRLPDVTDALVDDGGRAARQVRRRSPTPEGNAGEPDDVGLVRGKGEEPRAVAADE